MRVEQSATRMWTDQAKAPWDQTTFFPEGRKTRAAWLDWVTVHGLEGLIDCGVWWDFS